MLGVIFFENKLLLQPDVVFDSEFNGRNLSSLTPPGGDKKLFSIFSYKMTSLVGVGVFSQFFWLENNFFSPQGGARQLKLPPLDSESKTTSDCSNSLISKKIAPNSLFSLYQS